MKGLPKAIIRVDMEGIAGISHWDEERKGRCGYSCLVEQTTNEAVAAAMHRVQGGVRHVTSGYAVGAGVQN